MKEKRTVVLPDTLRQSFIHDLMSLGLLVIDKTENELTLDEKVAITLFAEGVFKSILTGFNKDIDWDFENDKPIDIKKLS